MPYLNLQYLLISCGLTLSLISCYSAPNNNEIVTSTTNKVQPNPPKENTNPTQVSGEDAGDISFFCGQGYDKQTNGKLPTTFVRKSDGSKAKLVIWETDYFTRSGFPPEERCQEVSPRFNEAYHSQSLDDYITIGQMNDQTVICTAKAANAPCDRLLLTLRPKDNPEAILEHLAGQLSGKQTGALRHTGGERKYYKISLAEFINAATFE